MPAGIVVPPARPAADVQSEVRRDPFTGRLTLVAGQRDRRPMEFVRRPVATNLTLDCPFCAGGEWMTPAAVHSEFADGGSTASPRGDGRSSDWTVRVVPNRFPAVSPKRPGVVAPGPITGGPFQSAMAFGRHEVVIESPRHRHSLSDLDVDEIRATFRAYRSRLADLRRDRTLRSVQIFKNVGPDAGASLSHSHSQIIATNFLPDLTAGVVRRMRRHHAETGCCLRCEVLREEHSRGERIVAVVDGIACYCPHASRTPMAMRLTPITHAGCLTQLDPDTLAALADLTRRSVGWMERVLGPVAYNVVVHVAPPNIPDSVGPIDDAYHLSIDITPRITHIAGYELGSDVFINAVSPEDAATRYRDAVAAESL